MTTRKYSSRSQQTTLASNLTDTATTCTVVSGSALLGGASVPSGTTFTVVIDPDTALEEIVDVTVVSTNTLTIVRGVENAGTGQAHSAGAAVRHMAIGRDFREANLHIEATGGYNDGTGAHTMHGIAAGEGDVVGTLKTQTLTNKTLTAPTITNPNITGAGVDASIVFEGAVADAHETTLTVAEPTQDNTITLPNTTGTVVLATAVQTLTNKTMGDALNAGGFKITNLATPTLASDAVRKDFADAQVAAAATSAASASTSASSAATSASSALTSANSAAASATAAATSAASAATSASTMAASVTAAASSATQAATSATSAAASATAAATSATSAATSASSASTSASSALTSANSAAASATTAANSVATIAGYATSAANSATAAATSATSAATSASSALTSQTAAATSATSAAASATAAATSATSAAASATAAATSATSAAASATEAAGYVVPSQTGNAGKALTTDGTTTTWSSTINGTAIPASKTIVTTDTTAYVSTDGGSTITVASGSTVPLTIQNNGTGNSFVVNDVASDTTPFVIDQSGNVGIGTTTPSTYGLLGFGVANSGSTNTPVIGMYQAAAADLSGLRIAGYAYTGVARTTIDFIQNSLSNFQSQIAFSTTGAGSAFAERMRITSAGLVGIGVTPSGAMLQVVNNTAANVGAIIKGASAQSGDLLQIQNSSGTTLTTISSSGSINKLANFAAKGDLLSASAASTPSTLSVGADGETLVADSSTATGLAYSGANQVNPVINSSFDIAQRGTSIAGIAGAQYTLDRWRVSGGTGRTYSQQNASLDGFQYCARLQRDSGNSSTTLMGQSNTIETSNALFYRGKTLTLSFYARKGADYTSASDALLVRLFTGTAVNQAKTPGASLTGEATLISQTATLTTSWQKFSYTTTSTVANSANVIATSFQFSPVGTASTDDYFEMTGVQLDIGSVALPYRRTGGTIQGELAACQRYYYRTRVPSSNGPFGMGFADSTSTIRGIVQFPVEMRTNPTALEQNGTASDYGVRRPATNVVCTAVPAFSAATKNTAQVAFTTGASLTTGEGLILTAAAVTTAFLGWSAEL
jgi:hypothetical protein